MRAVNALSEVGTTASYVSNTLPELDRKITEFLASVAREIIQGLQEGDSLSRVETVAHTWTNIGLAAFGDTKAGGRIQGKIKEKQAESQEHISMRDGLIERLPNLHFSRLTELINLAYSSINLNDFVIAAEERRFFSHGVIKLSHS